MKNDNCSQLLQVLVADDSVLIREGLAAVLRQQHVVACEVSMTDTIEQMKRFLASRCVDVVIVNPYFNGGFDLTSFIAGATAPRPLYFALCSSVVSHRLLHDYDGCFNTLDSIGDIVGRLQHALSSSRCNDSATPICLLTRRERDVVACIARGMTNREIACRFGLSIHTVITHRRNILHKLKLHSSLGIIGYAISAHLVDFSQQS